MGAFARDAIQSLRDTIWAIHSETVTLPEFQVKIRQFLRKQQDLFGSCRLVFEADGVASLTLTSVQALNLFRIVQEALNNALKHAGASQITVSCQLTTDQLFCLTIRDNGRGFVMDEQLDAEPHYGLLNMNHRAAELNGYCQIESVVNSGTSVSVLIRSDGSPVPAPVAQNTTVSV